VSGGRPPRTAITGDVVDPVHGEVDFAREHPDSAVALDEARGDHGAVLVTIITELVLGHRRV
jgi:hypothetical protein